MNESECRPDSPSKRRLLKAAGISAAATPFLGSASLLAAKASAAEGQSSTGDDTGQEDDNFREMLVETGTNTSVNIPSFSPDFLAVHSLGLAAGVAVVTDGEDGGGMFELPLYPCGKFLNGLPSSPLRRVSGTSSYAVHGGQGTPVVFNMSSGKPKSRSKGKESFPGTSSDDFLRGSIPAYYSRQAWGGDDVEDLRFDEQGDDLWGSDPVFFPCQKITVHHTVTENNDPDPVSTVRAIYEYHTLSGDVGLGFGDIGYNLLIDEAGIIYEGRYSGDSVIPGHTTSTELSGSNVVQAAHVAGYNSGNFGIALIGDFEEQRPTDEALASLEFVLTFLCGLHGIDPTGTETYTNPASGEVVEGINNVSSHLEWAETVCAGMAVEELPDIRQNVDSNLQAAKSLFLRRKPIQ